MELVTVILQPLLSLLRDRCKGKPNYHQKDTESESRLSTQMFNRQDKMSGSFHLCNEICLGLGPDKAPLL